MDRAGETIKAPARLVEPMTQAVVLDGLAKAYGDVVALDGVSFQVRTGEAVALLGPNGAGKSTLMSILATLKRPDAGDARVMGHSVQASPGKVRRRLGVAFQEPLVSKHLTALEVLDHHGHVYGLDRATRKARAGELIERFGLADRADDHVATFSGGMKRRLDLARVLVPEPDVLLLDEPTAGLDVAARLDLQARIRELASQGTTVLVATHDMQAASAIANRVAILDDGRLLAMDAPGRLAREMGQRVVRVDLAPGHDPGQVDELEALLARLGEVFTTGTGAELVIDEAAATTPGHVVDALDDQGVGYEAVTVREPDLGDVFLELTGRRLTDDQAAAQDPEVAA